MINYMKNNKARLKVLGGGKDEEIYLDKDSGNTSAYLLGASKEVKP